MQQTVERRSVENQSLRAVIGVGQKMRERLTQLVPEAELVALWDHALRSFHDENPGSTTSVDKREPENAQHPV